MILGIYHCENSSQNRATGLFPSHDVKKNLSRQFVPTLTVQLSFSYCTINENSQGREVE